MSEVAEVKVGQLMSPENRTVLVPKVDCFFNHIITSAHNMENKSGLITSQGMMSMKQVVVAAGPNACVKVGDWVMINVETFPKSSKPGGHDVGTIHTIIPPIETIGTTDYLYMADRSIKYRIHKKE